MKTVLLSTILLFISSLSWCQNLIQSNTEINKTINLNDTINLQFVDWPSPGMFWQLDSNYDTTLILIKEKSFKLMEGNFPKGGKYIRTIQYKGKKPGEVRLVYTFKRHSLNEETYFCKIDFIIK